MFAKPDDKLTARTRIQAFFFTEFSFRQIKQDENSLQ